MIEWNEAFQAPNKVKCDCEWPCVQRSGSQALGIVLDIDLCCLVKAVEKLTGEKFYNIVYTKPAFEWDCDCDIPVVDGTGEPTGDIKKLGMPPTYMVERMDKKGIPIHHRHS